MRLYRKLISRWVWNVNAVMEWKDKQHGTNPPDKPEWWQPSREAAADKPTSFSEFVGQGRQMGYNGLAYAVLISVYDTSKDNRRIQQLNEIADRTLDRLNGSRPGSWWILSMTSLAIVWLEIGMAFMLSYNVPTVGIGCRSMSYIIYGGLSTLPWIIHLFPGFKNPGVKRKTLCYMICCLSTFCLIFITFAAVSRPFLHLHFL